MNGQMKTCRGFAVKQNFGKAIASALRQLISLSPLEYTEYQDRCRHWIQPLGWSTVVQKHLALYQGKDQNN